MASQPPELEIRISQAALRDLERIGDWTATQFGPNQADRYLRFLKQGISDLAASWVHARPVPHRENFYYITLRRRRGHGHVLVFEKLDHVLVVLRFFHTAQDWTNYPS